MASFVYPKTRQAAVSGIVALDLANAATDIRFILLDMALYGLQITAATNATPIAVTTPVAHGLTTGDRVAVGGALGNTGANGVRQVTVTSTTTLTLDGSVGNGVYTSGGYAIKVDVDDFLDDVPVGARIAVSGAVTAKTLTTDAIFDCADVTLVAVTGTTVEAVVGYIHAGVGGGASDNLRRLLVFIDGITVNGGPLPFTPNGGDVTLQFNNTFDKLFAF